MGTPNDHSQIMVLGALFALAALVLLTTPALLYLAFGFMAVVYGWYALVCIVTSVGLLVYLLRDHDQPSLPVRKITRIT